MTQSSEKLEIIIKLSFEKYSQTSACDLIFIHTITQFYMYKNHHKAEFWEIVVLHYCNCVVEILKNQLATQFHIYNDYKADSDHFFQAAAVAQLVYFSKEGFIVILYMKSSSKLTFENFFQAAAVAQHPYFWSAAKSLDFLLDVR